MVARALLPALLLVVPLAVLAPAAGGHTLEDQVNQACALVGPPPPGCILVAGALVALQRAGGGATFGDFTDDAQADIEVANFYFNARLSVIDKGQTVVWTNVNDPGGNRHSVISSDWGGASPVLPAPGLGFGGGKGFKSGELQPGDPFTLTVNIETMNTDGYMPLPNGDFLIAYHCYIHGAAQMNGYLLVKGAS